LSIFIAFVKLVVNNAKYMKTLLELTNRHKSRVALLLVVLGAASLHGWWGVDSHALLSWGALLGGASALLGDLK
jgi:succinate dehydrogenase hydrophobic anchor subunit